MAKKTKHTNKSTGWARTKNYPHKKHPATYRRTDSRGDNIEYITFTHHPKVDLGNKLVYTIPLKDNISHSERKSNTKQGKKPGENRSYAYPKVFVGKRSMLHKETKEFEPVEFDKKRINKMFDLLPREKVTFTGGNSNNKKRTKRKKSRRNRT